MLGRHVAISAGAPVSTQSFQEPIVERDLTPSYSVAGSDAAIEYRRAVSARFLTGSGTRLNSSNQANRSEHGKHEDGRLFEFSHVRSLLFRLNEELCFSHEYWRESGVKTGNRRRFLLATHLQVESPHLSEATMAITEEPQITALLIAWRQGDQTALDQLMPLVYQELRRLAHHLMARERSGNLLQTTALVNEAFLRLIGSSRVEWESRAHFFAVAAQLMRRVLVDAARERQSHKRGGEWIRVSLADATVLPQEADVELIDLDEALNALTLMDKRKAEVVVLRYFGGLTVKETATVLNLSQDTVMRDWSLAKVWLYRQLRSCGSDDS